MEVQTHCLNEVTHFILVVNFSRYQCSNKMKVWYFSYNPLEARKRNYSFHSKNVDFILYSSSGQTLNLFVGYFLQLKVEKSSCKMPSIIVFMKFGQRAVMNIYVCYILLSSLLSFLSLSYSMCKIYCLYKCIILFIWRKKLWLIFCLFTSSLTFMFCNTFSLIFVNLEYQLW